MIKPFVFRFDPLRVIDGDTILGDLDLGMRLSADNVYVRLHGVDCPEIRGKNADPLAGQAAKAFTERWLAEGGPFVVDSIKFNPHDSFARIVGIVYRQTSIVSLNDALVAEGHAKRSES